jgi:hypothetical protein
MNPVELLLYARASRREDNESGGRQGQFARWVVPPADESKETD